MHNRFIKMGLMGALVVLAFGSAHANNVESYRATHALQHSIYNMPAVSVTVNNGIATISGAVDSVVDKRQVERVIKQAPGVERVVNLVTTD